MMLTAANPDRAIANEVDDTRNSNLREQGFAQVSNQRLPGEIDVKADVVVMNPPFGAVKGENGKSLRFTVGPLKNTTQIDHAIALNALEAMPDDGRAVMILGSVAKTAKNRGEAYNAAAKRKFYYHLYDQYNVTGPLHSGGRPLQEAGRSMAGGCGGGPRARQERAPIACR